MTITILFTQNNMAKKQISQEQVWDKIAPFWNKYKSEPKLRYKPSLLNDFIKKTDKKVLDLGCGSGRNFFKFNGIIYGIDFSAEQLKYAEENAQKKGIKVILTKSKAEKIPFEDNFFDKTIFIATLHCIKGKQNRKKVLKEIYRALKPNGKVLITAWNKNSKRWKNKPKETKVSWNIKENEKIFRYYYLYSYEELKKELEKTGFKVTEINKIDNARNIVMIGEKPKFKSS